MGKEHRLQAPRWIQKRGRWDAERRLLDSALESGVARSLEAVGLGGPATQDRDAEEAVVPARERLARISSWWSAAQSIRCLTMSFRPPPSGASAYSTRGGTSA